MNIVIHSKRVQNECLLAVMQMRMGLATETQARHVIESVTGAKLIEIRGTSVLVQKYTKDADLDLNIQMNCLVPIGNPKEFLN